MRKLSTATLLLALVPSASFADTMPQMDFANPLTFDQVGWMAVILVVLYLLLSRWGLPQVGKVLENRAAVIAADLSAARAAKQEADKAVAALNATISQARAVAQAEVAKAVNDAKAKAAAEAATLHASLEAKLDAAEAQIATARAAALAAIKPVAAEAASTILQKLTGQAPDDAALAPRLDSALAARKVA
ncbi:MAG TPA: F0F1 ATP synthase subunit B [Acidocella sp.]|jgi:F-type H+-transporting ATPase subunit b|nr:F0F1 ATP synthase subunit B [Acidocella sp.]